MARLQPLTVESSVSVESAVEALNNFRLPAQKVLHADAFRLGKDRIIVVCGMSACVVYLIRLNCISRASICRRVTLT